MNKLAHYRKINNLSQSQLAEKACQISDDVDISVRTIQDIERGHRDINKVAGITLYVISKACNCTIEDLLEI